MKILVVDDQAEAVGALAHGLREATGHEVVEAVGGQRYVASSKALLTHMGFPAGLPRPPRLPVPAEVDAGLKAMVQRYGLGFAK